MLLARPVGTTPPSSKSARTRCSPTPSTTPSEPASTGSSAPWRAMPTTRWRSTPTSTRATAVIHPRRRTRPNRMCRCPPRPGITPGTGSAPGSTARNCATARELPRRVAAPFRCIPCWARTCGCSRSPNVMCGKAKSAPPHSPGSPTIRCTPLRLCREPPTARWRWPPPARRWATRLRSAISGSNECCCSMTRRR